jgi:aquaporin Z
MTARTSGDGLEQGRSGRTITLDTTLARKAGAELLGTALLVFFGAGVATVTFGFRAFGGSIAAGVLTTGLAFALVLIGLIALFGTVSGCHVNPAVTLGAYLTRQIELVDAVAYWIAQVIGSILGALLLLWVMHTSPAYIKSVIGLGTNGYGSESLLRVSAGGAFLTEIIITTVFVMIVLHVFRKGAIVPVPGVVVGFSLGLMNIMAIPIDGASVNPARSLGPAVVRGGQPLSQLWVFLLAPLIGAVLAAGLYLLFHPAPDGASAEEGQDSARPEPGAARELLALWPLARGGETIAR